MDPGIRPRSLISSAGGIDLVVVGQQEEEEMNIQLNGLSSTASESQLNMPHRHGDLIEINVEDITPTLAMTNADVELEDVPAIQDTVQILLGCVKRGQDRGNQYRPSICMVPKLLRDVSPSSFNPRMVSIGPLHKDDKDLQEFEMEKETYLHDYLSRRLDVPPKQTLKECVQILNTSIDRIRKCYMELTYTNIELVKMMVIDSCFILEFLHKLASYETAIVSSIILDLMLLENQIPFFVLQDIFKCTTSESPTFLIDELLLLHYRYIDPFHEGIINNTIGTDTTHDHILAFFHRCYDPVSKSENLTNFLVQPKPHTATELHRAGLNFECHQDKNWPMGMKYESSWFKCFYRPWGNPTLKMPCLFIEDATEVVLRNFIAYEQSPNTRVHYYFTSYTTAIYMLVRGQEDIEKLVESEVFSNDLDSNEEAVKMIKGICKEVVVEEFFYDQQWEELDSYCRRYWPKNIAWFTHTYFNSPWNIIALLAGIILFALTVVQTFFTIKGT